MYTSGSFKMMAKLSMRNTKNKVYLVSAVYVIIVTVMNFLINQLVGMSEFLDKVYDAMNAGIMPGYSELIHMLPHPEIWELIISLALSLMVNFVGIGFAGYCLKVSRGQEGKVSDLMCGFEFFGRAFVILLLRTIFVALWSMIFVVPGIIVAIKYSQSYYVMFDNPDLSAYRCMRASGNLMQGFKSFYFIMVLSFILWHFLDSMLTMLIFIPVVSIYLLPYMGVTYAHFYNARIGYVAPEPEQSSGGDPFNM